MLAKSELQAKQSGGEKSSVQILPKLEHAHRLVNRSQHRAISLHLIT